jgi:hypothetical protein
VDKHSGGISKGAEASPQPKQTNKQTQEGQQLIFSNLSFLAGKLCLCVHKVKPSFEFFGKFSIAFNQNIH